MSTERLAEEAVARMDAQIDLTLQVPNVLYLDIPLTLRREVYDTDLPDIWRQLPIATPTNIEGKVYYRTNDKLFCERLLVISPSSTKNTLQFVHRKFGHPGVERTVMTFLQNLFS